MSEQVGRNDPCPCGSGKKYKKCCFQKDMAHADAHIPQPKQLTKRKVKVIGSAPKEEVFSETMEKQQEVDAEALARAVERESKELLKPIDELDYREVPSVPPKKRSYDEEEESFYAGERHDTE